MGLKENFSNNLKLETSESVMADLIESKNPVSLYLEGVKVLGKMEKNFDDALGNNPYDHFDGNVDNVLDEHTLFEEKAKVYRDKAKDLLESLSLTVSFSALADSKLEAPTVDEVELNSFVQDLLDVQKDQKEVIENDNIYDYTEGERVVKLPSGTTVTVLNYSGLKFDKNDPIIDEVEFKVKEALNSEKLELSKDDFNYFFAGDLKQANVGNCYLVSALYSMSSSPMFELMVRSSVKKLGMGVWEVHLPLMSPDSTAVRIYQSEINATFMDEITGEELPLTGNEGFRVLEAAYTKHKFGSVDREKSEGGDLSEAVIMLGGDNFIADSFKPSNDMGKLEYFLMRYHKKGFVAGANTRPKSLKFMISALSSGDLVTSDDAKSVFGKGRYSTNHAYSIVDVYQDEQKIVMANPWDTGNTFTMTFKQFAKYFDTVSSARVDYSHVKKNIDYLLNEDKPGIS